MKKILPDLGTEVRDHRPFTLNISTVLNICASDKDTTCPVCITPLPAIIAEEEIAQAMESPAHAFEEMGVTRLWIEDREEGKRGCGHLFCRRW